MSKLDTNFWKKYFEVYDMLNELIPYQELMETLSDELQIKPGDRVLDAGSGTGNLAIRLKERGASVVGIDFSPEGIARHKIKDPEAKLVLGDLSERLPFDNESFDKVVSNNAVYAIKKELQPDVFEEFYRIIKPGGMLVVSNVKTTFKPLKVYFNHFGRSVKMSGRWVTLRRLLKLLPSLLKMLYYNILIQRENKIGNYNMFSPKEQYSMIKNAGFKQIKEDTLTYAGQAIFNVGIK
jgi:ubiquinone/menaquinone biosynthesis C-methylase UbiE